MKMLLLATGVTAMMTFSANADVNCKRVKDFDQRQDCMERMIEIHGERSRGQDQYLKDTKNLQTGLRIGVGAGKLSCEILEHRKVLPKHVCDHYPDIK